MLLFITLKAVVTIRLSKRYLWGAAETGHTGAYPTNTECEPISWRGTHWGSNINIWHQVYVLYVSKCGNASGAKVRHLLNWNTKPGKRQ